MKAIVLVGGEGTRLRPLTYTTPKPMLPIGNVPMIERVVGSFADLPGLSGVVLSLGYKPDAFRAGFPDDRIGGLPVTYAVEPEKLDTAGAIRFAAEAAAIDDTFLVFNGDVLSRQDFGSLLELHRSSGAEATISLTPVDDPSRFGVVPTAADGRVEGFIEKPAPGTAPTNEISAGAYVMEPAVLARIPAGRPVSVERETFPQLVDEGRLYARSLPGYWLDTGTPQQFVQANVDLFEQGDPPRPGAGADVDPAATIERSALGPGVTVGKGALVQDSVLLGGVHVGAGASVMQSIIGFGARIGADAVVGGFTIVADGAEVAAGTSVHEGRIGGPDHEHEG